MEKKTYIDNDESFDYVAEVLHPTMRRNKREALAELCMEAYFLDGPTPLDKFHPKAAGIIEQLAIRLMGTDWCQEWRNKNLTVSAQQHVPAELLPPIANDVEDDAWVKGTQIP